ncbi:MAG: tRNA uridine-5-carboxymethylaminomethyl(34) synthesis enzyme MnmG [Candidatus Aureabacteria bacterium]|nr:tRNA uridine-5-carboxymethylaminomethyl(34) synthesis enzyme MnmG [Candidatus Auribacterota bacterium]
MRYHSFDIVVIGGGHAGCEAALACARMGAKTALFTINIDTIAQMSCNPSIGGIAKGEMVREIDALGGAMGRVIDATGIQFRMLNTKKGPAVWGPRAQADKKDYQFMMKNIIESQEDLTFIQDEVTDVLVRNHKVCGIETVRGQKYTCKAAIVTTGTFLGGMIYIGPFTMESGRFGEPASKKLVKSLASNGIRFMRLKTGTPARINGKSIDYSSVQEQAGDDIIFPFSFSTEKIEREQIPCYITRTTKKTRDIVRRNLSLSPLYSGKITGVGVRYCPSLEDKFVKFPQKETHQIFLEPEGRKTNEVYVNGASSSLPEKVQEKMIRSIRGIEKAEIMRIGYAIEYEFAPPVQLRLSLESKCVRNLFLAGQINGTSGYEEAAGQGIMAGINAFLNLSKKDPFILKRSESYIGTLIDDLVTKGTEEPYRMFTSRSEYRLLLRQDNADIRLMPYAHRLGLVGDDDYRKMQKRKERLESIKGLLKKTAVGKESSYEYIVRSREEAMASIKRIARLFEGLDLRDAVTVYADVLYSGYVRKMEEEIRRLKNYETLAIPEYFQYSKVKGLKKESVEKLVRVRPSTIGQAMRISGITPADATLLMMAVKRKFKI